jgi:hypothetical protein
MDIMIVRYKPDDNRGIDKITGHHPLTGVKLPAKLPAKRNQDNRSLTVGVVHFLPWDVPPIVGAISKPKTVLEYESAWHIPVGVHCQKQWFKIQWHGCVNV